MSALVKINPESGLYVLSAGSGYSCLGFEVAERLRSAVLKWIGADVPPIPLGTVEHFEAYRSAMARGAEHATRTRTRCPAELSPALIGREGKRVEVTHPDGTRERFYVGKSTGWLPIHLAIPRRDSSGGPAAYIPDGSTVRTLPNPSRR